jgi:uncharacterized protein (DUF433 family)
MGRRRQRRLNRTRSGRRRNGRADRRPTSPRGPDRKKGDAKVSTHTSTSTSTSASDREIYTQAEAAGFLGVPPPTLRGWLEGDGPAGRTPILRPQPRGGDAPVTWAEFVAAGLLREYDGDPGAAAGFRAFADGLRERFDLPHPLADRQTYAAGGRRLVLDAQDAAGLDPAFCLVGAAAGRPVLMPPAAFFLDRVDWRGDAPAAWRPHADPRSPVRVDPDVRFGVPAVGGVCTELIWEHAGGGWDPAEVAAELGVAADDVRWALVYEHSRRAA